MKIIHITCLDRNGVDLWGTVEDSPARPGSWRVYNVIGDEEQALNMCYVSSDLNDEYTIHDPIEVPPEIWAQLLVQLLCGN